MLPLIQYYNNKIEIISRYIPHSIRLHISSKANHYSPTHHYTHRILVDYKLIKKLHTTFVASTNLFASNHSHQHNTKIYCWICGNWVELAIGIIYIFTPNNNTEINQHRAWRGLLTIFTITLNLRIAYKYFEKKRKKKPYKLYYQPNCVLCDW